MDRPLQRRRTMQNKRMQGGPIGGQMVKRMIEMAKSELIK